MSDFENIYDFYINKLIKSLCTVPITHHLEILKDKLINVVIFDFCGKIKYLNKHFKNISVDVFVVYNAFENDIFDILDQYDLVYFIDDIEFIFDNVFYTSLVKPNFLFIVYDGNRFLQFKTNRLKKESDEEI